MADILLFDRRVEIIRHALANIRLISRLGVFLAYVIEPADVGTRYDTFEHEGHALPGYEPDGGRKHGYAHDDGHVPGLDGVYEHGADAGYGEDALRDDGPAYAAGEADAGLRDDGHEAVGDGVAENGGAPGGALGPGRAYEVLPEHVEHAGAAHAYHGGEGVGPEHERGQDEVRKRADARGGQPVQREAEQYLAEYGQPEGGHGEKEHGDDHAAVVEEPVLPDGGEDAYGYAEAHGPERRREGQQQGIRQALHEGPEHVEIADPGRAEVQPHHAEYVAHILHDDGQVEPHLMLERGQLLLRGVRAEYLPRRVPGREGHDEVQYQRHAQDDRYEHQQALERVFHKVHLPSSFQAQLQW